MAPAETISVLPLLRTVFASILQVFIQCLAGWIFARKGFLNKNAQKTINRLNVSLFTPALLFSKVAFFLTPAKLGQLWIIPLFFVVVTLVSMLVSWCLGRLFRLKRSQSAFAMAASMFMNSNSLPIALMQSLVVTVKGLKWDKDDTHDAMLGRALTYLVLYSTLGMMLRWSYGVHLLSKADEPTAVPEPDETSPLLPDLRAQSSSAIEYRPSVTFSDSQTPVEHLSRASSSSDLLPHHHRSSHIPALADPGRLSAVNPKSHFFYSFPNTPRISQVSLSSESVHNIQSHDLAASRPSRLRRAFTKMNSFMTMPMWAALASLFVACVTPLQEALMQMKSVRGALAALGDCSIPLTLVVLGGYFHSENGTQLSLPQASITTPHQATARETSESTLTNGHTAINKKPQIRRTNSDLRTGERKTVFAAIMSRMILTPLVLLPLVAFLTKMDAHEVFDDPVFVVSSVLLIASPPALTLAQITQAASGDAFERLISSTIFWSYCILTPITTIAYVVLGLTLSKL